MTDKKLKSLIDHDQERLAVWELAHPKKYNGIACPKCAAETYDIEPNPCREGLVPPRAGIACACGYQGHRLA